MIDLISTIKRFVNRSDKTLDALIQEKSTETNSNIASVDAKVQAGNNLVGANNNTGGSVGVGSLSARINKLLTDWTTTRAGYLDASISSRATQAQITALETKVNNLQLAINNAGGYPPGYDSSCELILLSQTRNGAYVTFDLPSGKHIYYIRINSAEGQFYYDLAATIRRSDGTYDFPAGNNSTLYFGGKGVIHEISPSCAGDSSSGVIRLASISHSIVDVNRVLPENMAISVRIPSGYGCNAYVFKKK